MLVTTITQAVYPNGTSQPSVCTAALAVIFRGWPIPASLDTDLAAGTINVSVFPLDPERNATRYPRDWQTLSTPSTALTLTVEAATTITISGTPSVHRSTSPRWSITSATSTPSNRTIR